MSLIPFPDVPQLPGVPAVPRQPAGASAFGSNVSAPLQSSNATPTTYSSQPTPQWQVTDTNGKALITPDSVINFEYRGETKVSNYPVEQGSFASYNKTRDPYDARVTLACSGKGAMTRDKFLSTIDSLKNGLQLCSIVTPDVVLGPVNLIHVNYKREARQGLTLIMAELWFQEIRQVATSTTNAAKPDGADPQSNGQLAPVKPTPDVEIGVKYIQ